MDTGFRIVFFGTPDFAVASLSALLEANKNVVAVVTAPDKPAGRGHKLQASPVKDFALSSGLLVLQPTNLKSTDFLEDLASVKADLQIVVAFRMLPESVWNMPKHGTYNVHGSLLPDYRGAAPINWAIINGEKKTGVTTFKLKHEIDTGSILDQAELNIGENDNVGLVYERLMLLGANLLVESVSKIEQGKANLKPQEKPVREKHAPKIFKEMCKIDTEKTAQEIHNFVRGLSPFPSAYFKVKIDSELTENWKILETKTTTKSSNSKKGFMVFENRLFFCASDQLIEIVALQVPGKKRLSADDFLRGNRIELNNLQFL